MRRRIEGATSYKIYSSQQESEKHSVNRRKLFIGRYYESYTVRKYEFSSNESQNVGIVMSPNRKLYYKISPRNCTSGDLVLFTLKDASVEIDFLYPVKNALVIRNHDESDSKSVHKVDFYWDYKKYISLDNSCALTECYQELFTDEEYEKLLSSPSTIIFPRNWGHGIFFAISWHSTIKLFKIDTAFEDILNMELSARDKQIQIEAIQKNITMHPYVPEEFVSYIERVSSDIRSYVSSLDLELLVNTYKVYVESSYHSKSGGDDRLYANYEYSCEVEFDNYLTRFFPLPGSFSSRGYCNLYSCDDWKEYSDGAPIIQEKNIQSFLSRYNKEDHISFLLHEKISAPYVHTQYLLKRIEDLKDERNNHLRELDKYIPYRILGKWPIFFTSRMDLIDIILAFNNRDTSKYKFGTI